MAKAAKPKKIKKPKALPVDGLSAKDVEKIRKAIRKVWSWSFPRKLCINRATGKDGFARCEQCKRKVPKIHADHIARVGDVDGGFIARLFCPSKGLQALCTSCHGKKTKAERNAAKKFSWEE